MNILITGGASGLGEAVTRNLAECESNKIYFTFCKSSVKAEELEIEFSNVKSIFCDFENQESVLSLLAEIENLDIDALINNAFVGLETNYFHKINPEYFSENFIKNILPVIKITQRAIAHFRKKKSGRVITILSSYIVNKPPIGLSEYVAAKNYLLSLSKSWAVENVKFNISSNAISPSFMQTHLTAQTDERIVEEIIKNHPLKKILEPFEVADSVKYLLNASTHINGINLIINSASDIV